MSDNGLHDSPQPQDWTGGSDGRYAPLTDYGEWLKRKALESLAHSGCSKERHRAFEIIRDTLEEAGIPFLRANKLAERCYRALAEII